MNVKGGLFEGGTNKKGEGKREGCVGWIYGSALYACMKIA
jgi:hypothetical protein